MATRKVIRSAFEKCLTAVAPRPIVRDAISLTSQSQSHIKIANSTIPLSNSTKIVLIAYGKASLLMAKGARDSLQTPLLQKTFIIAPEQQKTSEEENSDDYEVMYGAKNNLPDENSVNATQKIIKEIQNFDSESTVFLFLISGGGSALLTAPRAPVTLSEKLETIKLLQSHGATIQELNIIRQKLSDVKGGKLLRNIKKGRSIALIISDCIGNPIDLIASGSTVIPKSHPEIPIISEILKNSKINFHDLPENVQKVLNESEDPIDIPNSSSKFQNFIVSSNDNALRSASEFLTSSGFNTTIVTSSLSGNADEIGRKFGDLIASESISSPLLNGSKVGSNYPIALLFGGETTVNLAENPGKGGRNQEMVLACLDSLKSRSPAHQFIFMSAGTDGQDGPTDAAGAIISNSDLLIPSTSSESLSRSDSYNFWRNFNKGASHLKPGPSGTNVMDIQILILDKLL